MVCLRFAYEGQTWDCGKKAGQYADGLHPNAGGYDKMARAWEPAIRAILSSSTKHVDEQLRGTSAGENVKPAVPAPPPGMATMPVIRYRARLDQ